MEEKTYQRDIKIRDLDVEVTFKVKGRKKKRSPATDDELKGKLVDTRV